MIKIRIVLMKVNTTYCKTSRWDGTDGITVLHEHVQHTHTRAHTHTHTHTHTRARVHVIQYSSTPLYNLSWILWKVFHQIGKYFKLLKYDMLLPNNIKHSNNNIHIVFIWNETLLISQWNNACSSLNEVFEIYEYDLTWTAL